MTKFITIHNGVTYNHVVCDYNNLLNTDLVDAKFRTFIEHFEGLGYVNFVTLRVILHSTPLRGDTSIPVNIIDDIPLIINFFKELH